MPSDIPKSSVEKPKKSFPYILYISIWIIIGLTGTELSKIDYKKGPQNFILKKGGKLIEHHFEGLYKYDAYLGWSPQSNIVKEKWGLNVKTLENGIRSNNNSPSILTTKETPSIMVFGGSFTFGDNVPDNDTWPAHLERLVQRRVLNAGVSSYGLDQSILRAEQLVPIYKPQTIIISIINDSFTRATAKVRHGVPKPYFEIKNGSLVLKNTPVPFKKNVKLDWFRAAFGYSYFVSKFMDSFFEDYWWKGTMRDFRYTDVDKQQLNKLLLKKLNDLGEKYNLKIILLIQGTYDSTSKSIKQFEEYEQFVRNNLKNISICNAASELVRIKESDPESFEHLFQENGDGHMSSSGNAFIAKQLITITSRLLKTAD